MAKDELVEMDMWMNKLKTRLKKFEPRLQVWKLKDEKISENTQNVVSDGIEENVNEQ